MVRFLMIVAIIIALLCLGAGFFLGGCLAHAGDACPCHGQGDCCCPPGKCPCPATVTVYSYQKYLTPEHAHTWAVFTKGKQSITISWMPAGDTRPLPAVPGRNWSHAKTIAWAKQIGAPVKQWGPIPLTETVWQIANVQAATLERGAVKYALLDCVHPDGLNCVRAASWPVGFAVRPGLYGFRGGEAVARLYCREAPKERTACTATR